MAIASYYAQNFTRFDKFSLFFLSLYSYSKLSIYMWFILFEELNEQYGFMDWWVTIFRKGYLVFQIALEIIQLWKKWWAYVFISDLFFLRSWMSYKVIWRTKYDVNHTWRYTTGDLGTKGSRRETPDSLGYLFNDRRAHRYQLCNPKFYY